MSYKNFLIKAKENLNQIKIFDNQRKPQYYIYDEKLGWKLNKNCRHNSLPYTIDSEGNRKTNTTKNKKLMNLLVVGDSMVHGDEVSDQNTWPYFLSKKIKKKFNLINLGVSGYGNDQSFLHFKNYQENKKNTKIAIFCFNSGNELRNINVQRSFLNKSSGLIYLKPLFIFKKRKIILIKPPKNEYKNYFDYLNSNIVKKHLKKYDFFYPSTLKNFILYFLQKLNLGFNYNNLLFFKEKKLNLTFEIFKLFKTFCQKQKIEPIILFLPKVKGQFKNDKNLIYLKAKLKDLNIMNYYPKENFYDSNNRPINNYYCKKNHYSASGGKLLANFVFKYLKKNKVV